MDAKMVERLRRKIEGKDENLETYKKVQALLKGMSEINTRSYDC